MNELYSDEEQNKERPYTDNHFRVAIIKADLDGMGSMFQKITDDNKYSQISELLNDSISIDGLDRAAKNFAPKNKAKWIFPFYAAGDDIFFAVSIANFMKGIDVCRHMLQSINNQLYVLGANTLKMSIGVDFTFNREPIRYYIDRVESQLECTKKAECPAELIEYLQSKIAINSLAFFDVDYDQIKIYKKSLAKHTRKCECREWFNNVESQQKPFSFSADEKKDVKKYLFTKPVDYLYSSLLKSVKSFLIRLLRKILMEKFPISNV